MQEFDFGRWFGLRWSAKPSAFIGWALVFAGLTAIGALGYAWTLGTAAAAALIGTLGFVLSAGWHQIGHAIAARRAGYPMTGVRYWGVLDSSLYPSDEPALPPVVHIRRALGGPAASLALAAALAIVIGLTGAGTSPASRVLQFLCVLNFAVYTLQVALPLGFNDGSTLYRWVPVLLREKR